MQKILQKIREQTEAELVGGLRRPMGIATAGALMHHLVGERPIRRGAARGKELTEANGKSRYIDSSYAYSK